MQIYNLDTTNKYLEIFNSARQNKYEESFVFMDEFEFEMFEERAAIMEYEGGLSRKEAEIGAYKMINRRRKLYAQAS